MMTVPKLNARTTQIFHAREAVNVGLEPLPICVKWFIILTSWLAKILPQLEVLHCVDFPVVPL